MPNLLQTTAKLPSLNLPPVQQPVALKPASLTLGQGIGSLLQSTIAKLNQQYVVKKYNSDGSIISKTISLSSLQTTDDSFKLETFSQQQVKDTIQQANLVPSAAFSPAQANIILQKSAKIDYSLCIKSQASKVLEFNTVKNPNNFNAQLNYNFYIPNETDITSQEDFNQDPFSTKDEVPRYVNLTWDTVETVNVLDDFNAKSREEMDLIATYLKNPRGNASSLGSVVQKSFDAFLKLVPSVVKDGKQLQLTDTHDLKTAFNSISNPGSYKNSAAAVININAPNYNSVNIDELVLEKLNE